MLLQARFASLDDQDLLQHFHHRPRIRYTPSIDAGHLKKSHIDEILEDIYTFNFERHCFPEGIRWQQNPSRDLEWLIMLHKCYFLVGLGYHYRQTGDRRYLDKWVTLTDSWIEQTEPGFIASDVTGRRIQNWVFAFYYFVHTNPMTCVSADFMRRFLHSLHQQVDYLRHHLTPERNHRTLELYSLFLAAVVFPEFEDAPEWLEFSIVALTENARQDILPDGVHCELSTFYHHVVLKNFLACRQLGLDNSIEFPPEFDQSLHRALEFSLWVHKPDGTIPSLSDGDTGNYCDLLEQGERLYGDSHFRYASTQGRQGTPPTIRSRAFSHGGYYILRSPWHQEGESFSDGHYLILDCGPLGAGNHGHLDLLNIEMAAYGRSLIVDPGRYTYDESGDINWRVRFRSTGFHNTVQVDDKNQARYDYSPRHGKYRIREPHPEAELLEMVTTAHFDYLHGVARSHEYTAVHHRKVFFTAHEYWFICDYLEDEQEHRYTLRYHLSPEANNELFIWQLPQGHYADSPNLLLVQTRTEAEFQVEPGFVSPVYGVKHPAPTLRFERQGCNGLFETLLLPYRQHSPRVIITPLQPPRKDTSSFHCRLERGGKIVHDYYFISHRGEEDVWKTDSIECQGRFCHLRLDDEGEILHAFALPGGNIRYEGKLQQVEGGGA